jgi:hypothetical protein
MRRLRALDPRYDGGVTVGSAPVRPALARRPGGVRTYLLVGLNPYRKHRRRPSDYVLVGGCLLVVLALVLWALLG